MSHRSEKGWHPLTPAGPTTLQDVPAAPYRKQGKCCPFPWEAPKKRSCRG